MPWGWVTSPRISVAILGRTPISSILATLEALSRIRMTSFSPAFEPEVATRKSISRPSSFAPNDPSWGLRFSEMSIAESTLKMFTTATPVWRSKGSAANGGCRRSGIAPRAAPRSAPGGCRSRLA